MSALTDYTPDPGRVLFTRDDSGKGRWSPDAPESLKARPLVVPYREETRDVACIPGDVRVPSLVPPTAIVQMSAAATITVWSKAKRKPAKAQAPTHPKKRPEVTITAILELQAQGLSQLAIAARLGCHRNWVRILLMEYERSSRQAAAAMAKARTCVCGRGKHAHAAVCKVCKPLVSRGVIREPETATADPHRCPTPGCEEPKHARSRMCQKCSRKRRETV